MSLLQRKRGVNMAEKRMMSKKIIDSDAFLEMPLSSQSLYFHLLLRADDDGFLNNAKKIMREIGANQNDYDMLIMKKFLIQFEEGVCVIKHWWIHNYIQKDRYKPTLYEEEKNMLIRKENGAYSLDTECIQYVNNLNTECIQDDSEMSTLDAQIRLDKIRLDLDKNNIVSKDTIRRTDVQRVVEVWNQIGVNPVSRMAASSSRYKMIATRIKEYGIDDVLKAVQKIGDSAFLRGENKNGWMITFDWFSRPNNFLKVLEGQYDDKKAGNNKGWEEWLNE